MFSSFFSINNYTHCQAKSTQWCKWCHTLSLVTSYIIIRSENQLNTIFNISSMIVGSKLFVGLTVLPWDTVQSFVNLYLWHWIFDHIYFTLTKLLKNNKFSLIVHIVFFGYTKIWNFVTLLFQNNINTNSQVSKLLQKCS